MSVAKELNPTGRFLMGPGPSDVHPRVVRAMTVPIVGYLDAQILEIMDEVKRMLREVFQTKNELTFPVSATGGAGMQTCLVNLLEPDDEIVVCVNGFFGGRICDIAERCRARVIRVEAPWATPIDPAMVKEAVGKCNPKIVAVVQAETSTGVLQPVEEIGKIAHEAGALFLVDAVTSLGGTDVPVDKWSIDAIYSCTQKCLGAPPMLSPVSFSPRAAEVIQIRKTLVQDWYFDVSLLNKYWGDDRKYHHTIPAASIYGLYEALRIVLEEGLESRFARHRRVHELLRSGLEDLGFEFLVAAGYRLPMLNAVKIPKGLEDAPTRKLLLEKYQIEIGGGLGEFAGKVWRIGLMGCSCTENHVNMLLAALRQIMK